MAIKHEDVKASGDKGLATEWNKEHIIDSNVPFEQYQAEELVLHSGTVFPTGAVEGQPFYRTDLDQIYFYDGSDWIFLLSENNLSDDIPEDINVAGSAGISEEVSRSDHVHAGAGLLTDLDELKVDSTDTTSANWEDVSGGSISKTWKANKVVIMVSAQVRNTTAGDVCYIGINIDGSDEFTGDASAASIYDKADANERINIPLIFYKFWTPGAHVIKLRFRTEAGGHFDLLNAKMIVQGFLM